MLKSQNSRCDTLDSICQKRQSTTTYIFPRDCTPPTHHLLPPTNERTWSNEGQKYNAAALAILQVLDLATATLCVACLRTAVDSFAVAAIMAAEKSRIVKLSRQVDKANKLMRLLMRTRPRPMKPTRLRPMKPTRLMSTTTFSG